MDNAARVSVPGEVTVAICASVSSCLNINGLSEMTSKSNPRVAWYSGNSTGHVLYSSRFASWSSWFLALWFEDDFFFFEDDFVTSLVISFLRGKARDANVNFKTILWKRGKKKYVIFQMASTQQILMIPVRVNTRQILKAYTLLFNSSFINI